MSSATGEAPFGSRDRASGASAPLSQDDPAPWVQIDWRSHQRWVHVDGAPLNVIDIGSGDPVLLIHGLGGSWPNWLEQLPVLSATHRVIALDLPGFGASPMPPLPVTIPGYARTIAGLMDALGIPSAAIVGNSMGGEISAELALQAPERVRRLVLISPAGVSTAHVARRLPAIRAAYPAVGALAAWVGANADQVVRRPRLRAAALSLVAARPREIAAEFAAEQIRGVGKPGFMPALEALIAHSQTLRERLPDIGCPTLVLWGDRDPVVPVRDAEVFASEIPGARKVIWSQTGHVAMFERAAEFNALLHGFLDS
jgi:pimeloyl-ACP methyl ester carboxylesterase